MRLSDEQKASLIRLFNDDVQVETITTICEETAEEYKELLAEDAINGAPYDKIRERGATIAAFRLFPSLLREQYNNVAEERAD